MKGMPFKPMTEKEFRKQGLHEDSFTLDEWNDMNEGEHNKKVAAAQEIILKYTAELSAVTGDREAVGLIRDRLRADEEFWAVTDMVEKMVEGEMHWISAILRAEGRRAYRAYGDKLEEIRAAREAERQAALQAERAEMESLSNFGMF